MGRHDEDPTTADTTDDTATDDTATDGYRPDAEPTVEPTRDEQVHEVGDEHFGLEGGVDVRPASARENLRLT
jgi:hypothetical protein